MQARRRSTIGLLALGLALAGCGGDEDASPATDSASASTDDGGSTPDDGSEEQTDANGGEVGPLGCPLPECGDGLLPQLAGIPVPPGVDTYGTGQERIDGLVSQQVFLTGTFDDAVAHYETEVVDAGAEITFQFSDADEYALEWTDADGRAVSISVRAGLYAYHPLVVDLLAPAG